MKAARLRQRFRAVRRLADDLHVVLGVENHPEPGADERLVVDDQDAPAVPRRFRVRRIGHLVAIGELCRALRALAVGSTEPGELRGQARREQLVDVNRPVEVLQPLRPEVAHVHVPERFLLLEERLRRLRQRLSQMCLKLTELQKDQRSLSLKCR